MGGGVGGKEGVPTKGGIPTAVGTAYFKRPFGPGRLLINRWRVYVDKSVSGVSLCLLPSGYLSFPIT